MNWPCRNSRHCALMYDRDLSLRCFQDYHRCDRHVADVVNTIFCGSLIIALACILLGLVTNT